MPGPVRQPEQPLEPARIRRRTSRPALRQSIKCWHFLVRWERPSEHRQCTLGAAHGAVHIRAVHTLQVEEVDRAIFAAAREQRQRPTRGVGGVTRLKRESKRIRATLEPQAVRRLACGAGHRWRARSSALGTRCAVIAVDATPKAPDKYVSHSRGADCAQQAVVAPC